MNYYKIINNHIFFKSAKYIFHFATEDDLCFVIEYNYKYQQLGMDSFSKQTFKNIIKNLDIITATTTEKIKLLLRIK